MAAVLYGLHAWGCGGGGDDGGDDELCLFLFVCVCVQIKAALQKAVRLEKDQRRPLRGVRYTHTHTHTHTHTQALRQSDRRRAHDNVRHTEPSLHVHTHIHTHTPTHTPQATNKLLDANSSLGRRFVRVPKLLAQLMVTTGSKVGLLCVCLICCMSSLLFCLPVVCLLVRLPI
jgi:hypothetical protein